MKKVIFYMLCALAFITTSCDDMDENYKDYRDEHPTYSPVVTNVSADSPEAKVLVLEWKLPTSNRLKSVEIIYRESSTKSEKITLDLVETCTITDLLLQAYTIEIYTIDIYGNRSIPIIKSYTPIPGRVG